MQEQEILKKGQRDHVTNSSSGCTRIASIETNQETTPQATPQSNVNTFFSTQPTGPNIESVTSANLL
jgi:hypothetical protein